MRLGWRKLHTWSNNLLLLWATVVIEDRRGFLFLLLGESADAIVVPGRSRCARWTLCRVRNWPCSSLCIIHHQIRIITCLSRYRLNHRKHALVGLRKIVTINWRTFKSFNPSYPESLASSAISELVSQRMGLKENIRNQLQQIWLNQPVTTLNGAMPLLHLQDPPLLPLPLHHHR